MNVDDACLVGRIDGSLIKQIYDLPLLEKEYDIIEVHIPEQLVTVNASYFIGAFGERLFDLSPVNFSQKYVFKSENKFVVKRLNEYVFEKYFSLYNIYSL